MFVSFFPRPLVLTVSAALWGAFAVSFWYTFGSQTGELVGFHLQASGTRQSEPLHFGRRNSSGSISILSWQ